MPYYPPASGGGSGTVDSVAAGNNIDVDATDPANPIVSVETLTVADISDITASAAELNTLDGITASTTELNYTDGVTSAIQTQLGGKQPLDSDLTTIAGLTATTDNFMVSASSAWASRTPAQAKTSLALVKGDVGLGNVDNTSDATKNAASVTLTNKTINASQLVNSTVTADKLATGAASALVATSQTTTSTTYTDLATSGPAVTVTIGANGVALVSVSCNISNNVNLAYMSFAVSGASTVAAADSLCISSTTSFGDYKGNTFLVTGLTPGSTTFTAKYRASANTSTFVDRRIAVVPL